MVGLKHYSVYRFGEEFVALKTDFLRDQTVVWHGFATSGATAAQAAREKHAEAR
jgi:hypothetical protein